MPKKKTHEEFMTKFEEKQPELFAKTEVLGEYVRWDIKIPCACKVCGHGKNGEDWKPTPNTLLSGHGCPECGKAQSATKRKKSHEDFIKELSEINPNVKVLGDYVNNKIGISCECLLCGHGKNGEDWKPQPHDLLSGKGCPKCTYCGTSWLQEELFKYFSQKYPSTLYRDKTLIGKELDIVIPELNIAIEPGSWYWHFENENKLSNDYHKQLLCKEKGYTCITLYDKCDFPDVLWYPALIYDVDIGSNKDILQQVIQDIEQIIQDHA